MSFVPVRLKSILVIEMSRMFVNILETHQIIPSTVYYIDQDHPSGQGNHKTGSLSPCRRRLDDKICGGQEQSGEGAAQLN